MFGCIIYSAACRKVRCGEETLGGGRFLSAVLPEKPRERQIRKAARFLRKKGVSRAVFPEGFSHGDMWLRYGIAAVDGTAFRRRLLPKILHWALGEGNCERGGIFAPRVDFGVQKAAELLAGKSRYLYFDCGRGTEALSAALRREWGAAAVREPTEKQWANCDMLVLFAPWKGICCGRVLPFYQGARLPWQYGFCNGEKLPPGVDGEQLLAALWEMGRLRLRDVEIF